MDTVAESDELLPTSLRARFLCGHRCRVRAKSGAVGNVKQSQSDHILAGDARGGCADSAIEVPRERRVADVVVLDKWQTAIMRVFAYRGRPRTQIPARGELTTANKHSDSELSDYRCFQIIDAYRCYALSTVALGLTSAYRRVDHRGFVITCVGLP